MTTSSPDEWPRTLDAAVQLLVSQMSEEDKERVKSTSERVPVRSVSSTAAHGFVKNPMNSLRRV